MKFPTPDYRGLATAPGLIVVASDFRWVRAFAALSPRTLASPNCRFPGRPASAQAVMCFGPTGKHPLWTEFRPMRQPDLLCWSHRTGSQQGGTHG